MQMRGQQAQVRPGVCYKVREMVPQMGSVDGGEAVQPDVFAAAFAKQLQGSGMLAVMRIGIGSAAPIIIHTLLEPYSQTV